MPLNNYKRWRPKPMLREFWPRDGHGSKFIDESGSPIISILENLHFSISVLLIQNIAIIYFYFVLEYYFFVPLDLL